MRSLLASDRRIPRTHQFRMHANAVNNYDCMPLLGLHLREHIAHIEHLQSSSTQTFSGKRILSASDPYRKTRRALVAHLSSMANLLLLMSNIFSCTTASAAFRNTNLKFRHSQHTRMQETIHFLKKMVHCCRFCRVSEQRFLLADESKTQTSETSKTQSTCTNTMTT